MYKLMLKILFLLLLTVLISCNKKYFNFEEYIIDYIFLNENILDDKIYEVEHLEYKARLIYPSDGTYFNIYENSDQNNKIFELKYWTEIDPIEIIRKDGNIFVKIRTKDNKFGWIKAKYVELF